jgi:hypothetical protein
MSAEPEQLVNPEALREQVREKYRAVVSAPGATYHFHTGRPFAERLGYDRAFVDALPAPAVESFAVWPTGSRYAGRARVNTSWTSALVPASTRSSLPPTSVRTGT